MERTTLGYIVIFSVCAILGGINGSMGLLVKDWGLHTFGGIILGLFVGIPFSVLWKFLLLLAER